MKRRTEITTETREIWVITEGGVTQYTDVQPHSGDLGKVDSNETLVTTDDGDHGSPLRHQPTQGGTADHGARTGSNGQMDGENSE